MKVNTRRYIIFVVEFVVAAAIAYGIYYCKPRVLEFYRKIQVVTQIQKTLDFIKSGYSFYTQYDRIDNNYLISKNKQELLKDKFIVHYDGIITSDYGGNLLVFPSTKFSSSSQSDAFVFGFGALFSDKCIFLATYDWKKFKGVTPVALLASSVEQYTQILDEAHVGCINKSVPGLYSLTCADNSASFPMSLEQAKLACSCEFNSCFIAVKFY